MLRKQPTHKLQLKSEHLGQAASGTFEPVRGGSFSSPGCTVLSTCSPTCCDCLAAGVER